MVKPNLRASLFHLLLTASLFTLSVSAAAAKKNVPLNQPLDCVINPSVVADLGTGVPGILANVNVDRSDLVKAGEVIAELESGVESAALELARARAALTAEVDLRRVNAAFGQRQNRRTKDLFKRKAISTNDMDQRETEARLSQIQLRQARDNQDLAQFELMRAQEVLNRRTIKSPFDGVVMERFKAIGEYVEDQPVVRVARIDPLHVEVIVPVERLGMIEQGMHAKVWSEMVNGESWQAKVSRVDRIADVASGTFGVRLTMPNPDHEIPAGLRCRMQLVVSPPEPVEEIAETVPQVPREAEPFTTVEPVQDTVPEKSPDTLPDASTNTVAAKPGVPSVESEPDVETENTTQPEVLAVAVEQAAKKALPAGFKAIKRVPVTEHVAIAPAPEVSSENTAAGNEPVTAEKTIESVADAAPDPDQLAANLIDVDESVVEIKIKRVAALPECRLAGPYRDEVKATKKVVALRRAGLYVDIKSVPSSNSPRYMIATPVLRDRAEAKAIVAKLKAAGITDFYLPRSSRKPLRISLGLYNGPKIAKRQISKLEKKGFKAELLPWKQRGSDYYLVIRDVQADSHSELLASLPVPDRESDATSGFCNQIAVR